MVTVRSLEDHQAIWSDGEDTVVRTWLGGTADLDNGQTHFGMVVSGKMQVTTVFGTVEVPAGGYCSLPGVASIDGDGEALIVTRIGYRGFFTIGGPIERTGRLRYIDGCSDSVLIAPPLLGDPCLNFLSVPPGIDQTAHTHPSIRVGIIVSGSGVCRSPTGEQPLRPKDVFILPRDMVHSFHTLDDSLRIVVYHPDSDCGPSDDQHPMVTRTLVGGISAALLPEIRTVDLPA